VEVGGYAKALEAIKLVNLAEEGKEPITTLKDYKNYIVAVGEKNIMATLMKKSNQDGVPKEKIASIIEFTVNLLKEK
jgi:hypothetical protein